MTMLIRPTLLALLGSAALLLTLFGLFFAWRRRAGGASIAAQQVLPPPRDSLHPAPLVLFLGHSEGQSADELARRLADMAQELGQPVVSIAPTEHGRYRLSARGDGSSGETLGPLTAEEAVMQVEALMRSGQTASGSTANGAPEEAALPDLDFENSDRKFIARLTTLVRQGIARHEFSVEKLASDMCMSYSQLNRRLRSVTGRSVGAFVIQLRLEKARTLIATTDDPIGDIAMQCGFDDPSYFSRSFKQAFGQTPKAFRTQQSEA